jgi:putative membrane-bound dehydrogenase-like protein
LKSFFLADDNLIVELVAAEPDVVSPVAMGWDEDGRLYVVEMRDYPLGPGSGQIKRLEDRDGDGKYETAVVFADKLPFPTSVLPWKGGVLVTAAPDIWYLKDTDGDGKADQRRVVLTGFAEGNQQLRVNGLLWGLDNWVYGANGRSDGDVRKPGDAQGKAVSIRRRDFRFRPETGEVQAVAGFSQFGLARDDWGNRFLSWNTTPLRQVVFEERHLSRTPSLRGSSVAQIADPEDSGRLFRRSPPPRTFNNESVDFPNASCGVSIYRGDLLGDAYRGNAFVCEPLLNLVHRRRLVPDGPAFLARRGEQGKEFLASTDPWFHPVNVTTGPDGALYIADFYRAMVEHPHYVWPENLRPKIDFRKGADHGRIWRVRRKDAKPGPSPRLGALTGQQLVAHLNHRVGWWRDTAQRLLVERQDGKVAGHLANTAQKGKLPEGRVQALWTLHGLDALKEEWLLAALNDPHPRVREHAVQLCEGRLAKSPALRKAASALARDADVRVRFQLALVLGEVSDKDALTALAAVARRDLSDGWVRLAILSSLASNAWPFAELLLEQHPEWLTKPTAEQGLFLAEVGSLVGAQDRPRELAAGLELAARQEPSSVPGRLALLAGLGDGLARSGRPLRTLMDRPPKELKRPLGALEDVFQIARRTATSDTQPAHLRVLAVRVLAHGKPQTEGKHLVESLQPTHPLPVQSAAARGLGELGDAAVAARALKEWNSYSVPTRRDIIAALLRSPRLAAVLLDALKDGTVVSRELDSAARQALLSVPDPGLQKRAKALLAGGIASDRQKVVSQYAQALQLRGEPGRGATVFTEHCSNCHQLRGKGHQVGPDLSGIAGRPPEAILTDILDPSKEVAPDYVQYVLITKRGQVFTGLLAAETAANVTIRSPGGGQEVVPRDAIETLRATRKSLMPEGLEQSLSPQHVADLLAYLRQPAPPPK